MYGEGVVGGGGGGVLFSRGEGYSWLGLLFEVERMRLMQLNDEIGL